MRYTAEFYTLKFIRINCLTRDGPALRNKKYKFKRI